MTNEDIQRHINNPPEISQELMDALIEDEKYIHRVLVDKDGNVRRE